MSTDEMLISIFENINAFYFFSELNKKEGNFTSVVQGAAYSLVAGILMCCWIDPNLGQTSVPSLLLLLAT